MKEFPAQKIGKYNSRYGHREDQAFAGKTGIVHPRGCPILDRSLHIPTTIESASGFGD